jgi:LmbE family N-acetylglucosaminyl deacetylase
MFRHYVRQAARAGLQYLLAHRQVKMFLRTSLSDIDLRLQALASTTDFFSSVVQPVLVTAPFGKSVLVVAPHQDDEAIGSGGALILQRRTGNTAAVVVLHDGADEYLHVATTRDALRELRNAESRAAARVANIDEPTFLGLQDLRSATDEAAAALKRMITARDVSAIFTPFVLDGHPDHRACNSILARALTGEKRRIRVLQYEVWGQCIPNVMVIIDDVIDQKMEMLACFKFANKAIDYAHAVKGLNMFHSRLLPAGQARYVERFFELPSEEFIQLVGEVEAAESRMHQTRHDTDMASSHVQVGESGGS